MKDIIIVTGASSGIGYEFVKQIINKENQFEEIWVIARRKDKLMELKDIDGRIVPISLDLSKEEELSKFKDMLLDRNPNIKVLANCAGYGVFDHFENVENEVNMNMIDLNCKALVSMCNYCIPYMRENSHIVNIASRAAYQSISYINIYASTKAFVLSFSRALNQELKYKGIHVTTVTPYWTRTGFFDRAVIKDKKEVVQKYTVMYESEKVVSKIIKDMYNNKEISSYGFSNNLEIIFTKIIGNRLVMKLWMHQQKFDGTPNIRK